MKKRKSYSTVAAPAKKTYSYLLCTSKNLTNTVEKRLFLLLKLSLSKRHLQVSKRHKRHKLTATAHFLPN